MTADKPFTPHGHPSRSSAVSRYIDLYREHCGALPTLNNQECEAIWQFVQWALSESVPITYGQIVKDARAIVGISDDKQGEWDREGQAELLREFAEVIQKDRPDSAIPDAMRSIADTLAASPSDKVDAAYVIQKLRQRSDAYHHERHSGFYSNGDAALDSEAALLLEQLTKSAGLRSAESYECQIKAQHQVIAERDATIASLRSHARPSEWLKEALHNMGTHSPAMLEVLGDHLSTAQAEEVLRLTRGTRSATERSTCTLGVGCQEAGVCYAAAHGEPERCDAPQSTRYLTPGTSRNTAPLYGSDASKPGTISHTLAHHLRQAIRFITHTEAFGRQAETGILQAGNDQSTAFNVDEAKAVLRSSERTDSPDRGNA
jgi:hypothetical protein